MDPCGAAIASKICLMRFDNNKYPVAARAVGPAEVHAYAEPIVIRQDGSSPSILAIPGIT
jgi:hypothetical protein